MGHQLTHKTIFLNFFRKLFIYTFLDYLLRFCTLNKLSSSFIGRIVPGNYLYRQNTYRKFLFKSIHFYLDISDYVGHYLYFGFRDPAQDELMNIVKPGMNMLDIGTNIGSTLLQFAKLTGENGFVYGFEPDPINYQICLNNVQLNSFKNLVVANIGLGNEKGAYSLVVDTEGNRGGNRIKLHADTGKTNTLVQVEKLDDWIKQKMITQIDLIKIDVEGFEYNVLKGADETLRRFLPVLFIELDDTNLRALNSSAAELVTLLQNYGYTILHAVSKEKITPTSNFNNCHYDIIACKE